MTHVGEVPELLELHNLVCEAVHEHLDSAESWTTPHAEVETTLETWSSAHTPHEIQWLFKRWLAAIKQAQGHRHYETAVKTLIDEVRCCAGDTGAIERVLRSRAIASLPFSVALVAMIRAHAHAVDRFGQAAFQGQLSGRRALRNSSNEKAVLRALAAMKNQNAQQIFQAAGVSRAAGYRILKRLGLSRPDV